ncbi:MAG TPA: hypothetical protein VFJ02_00700, partial [Vicinamibacterales bacterium]|nr:hypothetical protein [Vicinamibacterales bacterium]
RRALVGGLILPHLQLLNQRRLLSIDELLAVEEHSPDYNEGERRSLFYAQSWALVHMLASGEPNRSADLARYAGLTSGGMTSRDAWRQVFGNDDIVRSLNRYVGQSVMKGAVYRFETEIARVPADVSEVPAGDAQAALADLLRRVATSTEATAAFERAIAAQPSSARARAVYGLHAIDEDRYEQGRQLLLAAADSADWLVQYHVATGLTRIAATTAEPDVQLVAAARQAVGRVLAARPDLAHALMLNARLDGWSDADTAPALASIRRARTLAPGRADYSLVESYILTRRGEYTAARELLAPLTGPGFSDSIRGSATRLIAEITGLERAMSDYIAGLQGQRPGATAASSGGDASGRMTTTLRKIGDGEQRVEGMLQRIDCSADRIVLEVRAADRVERYASPATGIEFISYRAELAGAIDCGPRQPPDHIYLTLRGDEPNRRIVAVEFLKN